MTTLARDTSLNAEQAQIQLLRQVSPARRFRLARSLSQTTLQMTRRTLQRLNPQASENEIRVLFLRTIYGAPLADRVRTYLANRS